MLQKELIPTEITRIPFVQVIEYLHAKFLMDPKLDANHIHSYTSVPTLLHKSRCTFNQSKNKKVLFGAKNWDYWDGGNLLVLASNGGRMSCRRSNIGLQLRSTPFHDICMENSQLALQNPSKWASAKIMNHHQSKIPNIRWFTSWVHIIKHCLFCYPYIKFPKH